MQRLTDKGRSSRPEARRIWRPADPQEEKPTAAQDDAITLDQSSFDCDAGMIPEAEMNIPDRSTVNDPENDELAIDPLMKTDRGGCS